MTTKPGDIVKFVRGCTSSLLNVPVRVNRIEYYVGEAFIVFEWNRPPHGVLLGTGRVANVEPVLLKEKRVDSKDKPILKKLARFTDPNGIGKYLVMRRDGTIPAWSSFVLGSRDKHAEVALRAYADSIATDPDCHPDLPASIYHLADLFAIERLALGAGDPTRGLHRPDNPLVLLLMQKGKSG